jgi:DNA-binding SARP family transcriptional activator
MAGHLALACKQCREDAAWHQLAGREAEHRERGLREQLGRALRLIGTGRAAGSSIGSQVYASVPLKASTVSAFTGESPGRSRWWRQILAWVGQKRPRPLSLQEGWEVSLSVPEASRPLRSDLPQDAPGEETTTELLTSDLSEQAHPSAPQPSALTENDPSGPSLAVYCLGRFRVYQDDRPIAKLTSSKARSILKYLIAHRERPVPKEVLMDLFWPNVPPDAARNNLNVAIYALRQALRRTHPSFSHVLFRDDCYLLNPELSVWVDSVAFEEHVAAALALHEHNDLEGAVHEYRVAEELYQGDYMDEDRYEDWPTFQRQRLQTKYLELLQQLSRYYLQQDEYASCAAVCNKMLAVDPCHEQAHRWLMRCYSRQGQPYLARRQYHLCVERLREELDLPPTQDTEDLYGQIRQGKQV